jgi:hypothetical protein
MDQSVGGPAADPRLTSLITRHMRKGAEVQITRHPREGAEVSRL